MVLLLGHDTQDTHGPHGARERQAKPARDDDHETSRGASARELTNESQARRRADGIRARLHVLRAQRTKSRAVERNELAPGALRAERMAVHDSAPRMPAPIGSGNQAQQPLGEYIRATVREQFLPMARGCYEEFLARQPSIGGTLALHIVIGGDPSVGGVVESVNVNADSTINDGDLLTCVVESMMALSFDAPAEGHDRVEFDYPFEFSSGASDSPR
jgi:hypothetical protein